MAKIILYGNPLWAQSQKEDEAIQFIGVNLSSAKDPEELSKLMQDERQVLILAEKQIDEITSICTLLENFPGESLLAAAANYPMVKAACLFISQVDFSALGKTLQAEGRSAVQIFEAGVSDQ